MSEGQVKKPVWKKPWFGGLIIILLFIAIGSFGDDSEQTPSPDPSAPIDSKDVSQSQPEVQPIDMEMEDYVDYLIQETVGEKTNMDNQSLIDTSFNESHLVLDLYASENLSNNLTRTGIWLDIKDIYKQAFPDREDINSLTLNWYLPLIDLKGNEELSKVMTINFTKENYDTINWENVLTDNIPKIANDYWEHPAFSN